MFPDPDPAERSFFMRLYYRDRRPTWFGHFTSQFFCWWALAGLPPRLLVALEVVDRESGRKRRDAVMTPTVGRQRYVVSMFGTLSDWVHNLEASQGDAAIYHGRREHVRLVLIPLKERAAVIKEFARIASSGRKHLPLAPAAPLDDYERIASLHPVYRVDRVDAKAS